MSSKRVGDAAKIRAAEPREQKTDAARCGADWEANAGGSVSAVFGYGRKKNAMCGSY